jgi:hypothetical protein
VHETLGTNCSVARFKGGRELSGNATRLIAGKKDRKRGDFLWGSRAADRLTLHECPLDLTQSCLIDIGRNDGGAFCNE